MGDREWDFDLERSGDSLADLLTGEDLLTGGDDLLIGEDRLTGEDLLTGGESRRGRGLGDRVRDLRILRGESLRWLRRNGLRSRVYRRGDFDRERRRLRLLLYDEIGRDSRALEIGLSRRDLGEGERRLLRIGDLDRRLRELDRRRGEWRLLRGDKRLDEWLYREGNFIGDFDRERDRTKSRVGGAGAGGMLSEPELTDSVSWISSTCFSLVLRSLSASSKRSWAEISSELLVFTTSVVALGFFIVCHGARTPSLSIILSRFSCGRLGGSTTGMSFMGKSGLVTAVLRKSS